MIGVLTEPALPGGNPSLGKWYKNTVNNALIR